ncbi:hypothetical protein PENDEC_c021G06283 [Penicillium decumbens]|uniref:Uncharacterized protein n=1 Tax=Penicillium decumbens TaxID=69771 RepID=A0A1V6P678_PENDC|nr:hypothetical protein PENDEC_c021G06283 [Penicillium decumbens]
MSANAEVPNAWEDDWESQADILATKSATEPEKKVSSKVTKAQRRAQQAEFNRQLWAEAETPQTFHFVEARSDAVPLKQDIKPAVTLLSRRPQIATRQSTAGVDGATAGFKQLGLDGEEGDSDDESKPREPTPEERQAIALRNREEKQRKYEEVRERLFGSPSATTSGTSSGSTTPPRQNSSVDSRGKGKGRGGRDYQKRDSSTAVNKSRHLYDPSTSARSNGPQLQRRERQLGRGDTEKSPAPQQPTRSPRGPDGSGRGGFGFGNRGARTS